MKRYKISAKKFQKPIRKKKMRKREDEQVRSAKSKSFFESYGESLKFITNSFLP